MGILWQRLTLPSLLQPFLSLPFILIRFMGIRIIGLPASAGLRSLSFSPRPAFSSGGIRTGISRSI